MKFLQKVGRRVARLLSHSVDTVRRHLRALPARTASRKRELLADPTLTNSDRELLRQVSSRVDSHDDMYQADGVHYIKVGLSAIKCIDEAVKGADRRAVKTILDLPCGSGRVLRFLRERFPEAEITASELTPGPVEFCVRTFGALPALSSANLDEVSMGRSFDLIWCGSLVTHLKEPAIVALLKLFRRHLTAGGGVVFTTHGDFVAHRMNEECNYGLPREETPRVRREYATNGYGYADHSGAENLWRFSDVPRLGSRSRAGTRRPDGSVFPRTRLGRSSRCSRFCP